VGGIALFLDINAKLLVARTFHELLLPARQVIARHSA
jgi:hypothetical protein